MEEGDADGLHPRSKATRRGPMDEMRQLVRPPPPPPPPPHTCFESLSRSSHPLYINVQGNEVNSIAMITNPGLQVSILTPRLLLLVGWDEE